MTCREKFYKKHAGMRKDYAEKMLRDSCPDDFGYLGDPEYCIGTDVYGDCTKCWDREIPEETITNSFSEHPCKNCNTGWGSISTEGCKSCHDTCEKLAAYNRQQNLTSKKEKYMIEPIEHTCADCTHQDVCKHMNEFVAAKQAIVEAMVLIGDSHHVKLIDIPCIKAVGLQCKFYRKDFQGGAIR